MMALSRGMSWENCKGSLLAAMLELHSVFYWDGMKVDKLVGR